MYDQRSEPHPISAVANFALKNHKKMINDKTFQIKYKNKINLMQLFIDFSENVKEKKWI